MRRPWKYVVRDYWSGTILHTTKSKVDAMAYARLHTRLNDSEVQIRRISTWYKAGNVWGTWVLGGAFDDWPGDDW